MQLVERWKTLWLYPENVDETIKIVTRIQAIKDAGYDILDKKHKFLIIDRSKRKWDCSPSISLDIKRILGCKITSRH